MSRLRLIGLALFLVLGAAALWSCSDDPPSVQSQPQPEQQESAAQPEQDQPEQEAAQQVQQAEQQEEPQQAQEEAEQPQAQQQAEPEPAQDSEAAAQQQQTAEEQAAQQQAVQEQTVEQQAQAEEPASAFEGVRGIVDPANLDWPREVEELSGIASIPAKPMRIITASIGHDEIVLALVPSERLVAVGAVSKDATFSNIADLVLDKPEVSRDPETIIAQEPDIVVTSPWYPIEGIEALRSAGILVVQTALDLDLYSQINNILLIGYILGEEERAITFAEEVEARFQAVLDVTAEKTERSSVISLTQYGDSLWTAGSGSTQGSLIVAAGGVNGAAEAGIEGNQTISLESVIAMAPDVIIIPQPAAYGAEEFRQSLFDNAALAEVPAIANDAVYIVDSKHFTTLSHWNIRGAEALARILWPDDFPDPPAETFSLAE